MLFPQPNWQPLCCLETFHSTLSIASPPSVRSAPLSISPRRQRDNRGAPSFPTAARLARLRRCSGVINSVRRRTAAGRQHVHVKVNRVGVRAFGPDRRDFHRRVRVELPRPPPSVCVRVRSRVPAPVESDIIGMASESGGVFGHAIGRFPLTASSVWLFVCLASPTTTASSERPESATGQQHRWVFPHPVREIALERTHSKRLQWLQNRVCHLMVIIIFLWK